MKSLSILILLLQSTRMPGAGAKLSQVLLQLNTALHIELNIFISLANNAWDIADLQPCSTAKVELQLSAKDFKNFHLLGSFSEKALIVVHIERPPIDDVLASFLPRLLWELHELHLVFVTSEESSAWQLQLYSYCFQQGFINVLLVQYFKQTMSFYSYLPYLKLEALKLLQLTDYLNRWRQLKNFHLYPIRTLNFTAEPRMIQFVNRQGEHVISGYMYDAFAEFIRRHNGTLTIVPNSLKDGDYEYAINFLLRKQIDFACYPTQSSFNLSSSMPLHLLKEYITVPYARPIASYLYFSRPFTWPLWLCVLATLAYGMLMLCGSYGAENREFGTHFLSSWCHLLFLPQPLVSISNWQQFVMHWLLTIGGFMLTNLYLALLSSMLTAGLFEPQLNTLEDLVHAPYPLIMAQYHADVIKRYNYLPSAVTDRIVSEEASQVDAARNALNDSYMYLALEDRIELIAYAQHLLKVPRFKIIPESFLVEMLSFPLARGLPYRNMFNLYLRRIFDSGIWQKMKSDAWQDSIRSDITKLIRTEQVQHKAFDLEFYFYAFALWGVGLTCAGLCLLLELLRWRMTQQFRLFC